MARQGAAPFAQGPADDVLTSHDRHGQDGRQRHRPRRLDRPLRAAGAPALSAPHTPRPGHRHVAAAVPVLVECGAGHAGVARRGADRAVRRWRPDHAGCRVRLQRHRRPRPRQARRPHRHAPASQRPGQPRPSHRLHGAAVPSRPRRALAVQLVRGGGRGLLPAPDLPLPTDEACHLLAAGGARPHLQLGGAVGVGGGARRGGGAGAGALRGGPFLDPRLRHHLRPPGQGGRPPVRGSSPRPSSWARKPGPGYSSSTVPPPPLSASPATWRGWPGPSTRPWRRPPRNWPGRPGVSTSTTPRTVSPSSSRTACSRGSCSAASSPDSSPPNPPARRIGSAVCRRRRGRGW